MSGVKKLCRCNDVDTKAIPLPLYHYYTYLPENLYDYRILEFFTNTKRLSLFVNDATLYIIISIIIITRVYRYQYDLLAQSAFFQVNTIHRRSNNEVTGVMMFRPSFAPPSPLCDLPPPPPLS